MSLLISFPQAALPHTVPTLSPSSSKQIVTPNPSKLPLSPSLQHSIYLHSSMAESISSFLVLLLITNLLITSTSQHELSILQRTQRLKHPSMREKLSHLRFYWHDILSGRSPTAATVARAPTTNSSATSFGQVNMIDDPLTLGPAMSSKLVGRAQGMYASAALDTVGLMMVMNLVFVEGKYNGSTITVLGRNEVFTGVREMAVVGGSGLFRFARGYVQARTHDFDMKTRNAVVRYDCFVIHY